MRIEDYGLRLAVITGVSAVVWLSAMLLTPPESEAVLETFIRKVQPPGPGWARLRQRFQVEPQESLSTLLARFVWSCGVLFGGLMESEDSCCISSSTDGADLRLLWAHGCCCAAFPSK